MAEQPSIDSVTTFVAELPGQSLALALKKFEGPQSLRTLAAARRIAAKKVRVKIPRNLLRQLWRFTGGFQMGAIKASAEEPAPTKNKSGNVTGPLVAVRLGDLEAVFRIGDDAYYGPPCWLRYRGQQVGIITSANDKGCWLGKGAAVEATAKAACAPWKKGGV